MNSPWPMKKLGEICDFIHGFSFNADAFNDKGVGLPIIRTGDLNNLKKTEKYYDGIYNNDYLVESGDLLIGLSGTIISGIWQGRKALLNQRVVKLINFKEVDRKYLSFVLPMSLKKLSEELTRSAVKNVLKAHLENLEVPLPPLPTQQKIVYILDTIQEAIGVQEKIIEKTKELKKSMMADLFKYGSPSFRKNRKLKKTEIGEIPEDWEVKQLGKLGNIKDGDWILNKDYTENEKEVRLIQIGDIGIGKFVDKSNRFISEEKATELACTFLQQGQILISRMPDPIGRACFVPDLENQKIVTAVDISIMTPDINKIYPNFLIQYLNSEFFFTPCRQLASGATRQRISRRNLETIFILYPPLLEEQREIADILQTIDQKIEIEEKKKALYEELFKAMLNKLMTGEIRVDDVNFK